MVFYCWIRWNLNERSLRFTQPDEVRQGSSEPDPCATGPRQRLNSLHYFTLV